MSDWIDAEKHVERAHELFELGRWAEAESELRRALSIHPDKPEWRFNLGLTLEASGRYSDAAASFQQAHELDSEDASSALAAGVNWLRADDPSSSLPMLERAASLEPANVEPQVHRIEALARLGHHDQAEVAFYLSQQIDPACSAAYAALAESLLVRGQLERAAWCFREAAQLDPEMPGVHARLASIYASTSRPERARQLYLRELRNDPGDIGTLLDLGWLLVEMHRFTDAGEKFRRVLELEPDHPDAHYALADVAQRQGLGERAIDQFSVVLRLEPDFQDARRRLGHLLILRDAPGDALAARSLLTDAVRDAAKRLAWDQPDASPRPLSSADMEELADLGRTLLDAKLPDKAKFILQQLLAAAARQGLTGGSARDNGHGPAINEAWHALSVACFQTGDRTGGVEAARKALEFEPNHVSAMHNMAVAAVQDRQWTRARYWVRRGLQADPEDGALRRLRYKLRFHALLEAAAWVGDCVLTLGRRARRTAD